MRETGRRVRRRLDRRAPGATRTWPRICVYWRSGLRPLPTGLGPAADALPPLPIAELCRGAGARVMRSTRRRVVFVAFFSLKRRDLFLTIRAGRPSVTRENHQKITKPETPKRTRRSVSDFERIEVTQRNLECARRRSSSLYSSFAPNARRLVRRKRNGRAP